MLKCQTTAVSAVAEHKYHHISGESTHILLKLSGFKVPKHECKVVSLRADSSPGSQTKGNMDL